MEKDLLGKAAAEYCQKNIPHLKDMHLAISTAFEAGAEWQKRQSEQKWISVKDELPNPWVPVLVRTRNNKFTVTSRESVSLKWNGSTAFAGSITHWIPIPKLPEGMDSQTMNE